MTIGMLHNGNIFISSHNIQLITITITLLYYIKLNKRALMNKP